MKIKLLFIFTFLISISKAQPSFNWAKQFKGTGSDEGTSIKTDAAGNIYTGGYFWGTTDFDPGPGVYSLTASVIDGFITKFDPLGNLLWAVQFKGGQGEFVQSIAIDDTSNIYALGYFGSTTDFDPGPGVYTLTPITTSDFFILKLNSSGNLKWVKQIGGAWFQQAFGCAIDKKGNVYTTGHFSASVDFDPGPGVYSLSVIGGPTNGFVLKLDNAGNFTWAKQFTTFANGQGISADASENVYTTGFFGGVTDFDPGPSTYTLYSPGNYDVYVSKLDKNGDFVWAKQFSGGGSDYVYAITLDKFKNVYTGGYYSGPVDFDPGSGVYTLNNSGGFISKLDSSGNLIWAKSLSGANVFGLTVDGINDVIATGPFGNTIDLDPGLGYDTVRSKGYNDAFIVRLNSKGLYQCGGTFGGKFKDVGASVTTDIYNNVYATGWFADTTDFDCSGGVYDLVSTASPSSFERGNVFVAKYSVCSFALGNLEIKENNLVEIFPNPSSGIFNIRSEFTETKVCVYDVLGNCISNKNYQNEKDIELDLSSHSKGIYFMEIISDGQKMTKKLILE